jgi:hypothetical protein
MLCAWVPAVAPRSLRGPPSQVKGASGVASAMPLRGTLDLRASTAPCGQRYGQATSLPSTTRATTAGTFCRSDGPKRLRPVRDCARKGWPLTGQLWLRAHDTRLAFGVR